MTDGWITKAFGECANLVREQVSPIGLEGTPYIGLEHIGKGTLTLLGHGDAGDVKSAKNGFRKGDILFGKLRPYFRKVVRAPFDGICSTDIWVVRARPGTGQGFLYQLMASQSFVDSVSTATEGTRMPRAQWEHVQRQCVRLPPSVVQRRVARMLGCFDSRVEKNRRAIETLDAMAWTIFEDWFVDFGPTRAKMEGRRAYLPADLWSLFPRRLEVTTAGEIPEGWSVRSFDEIADYRNGLALQKHRPVPGEDALPVVKIAQMRAGAPDGKEWASGGIARECVIDDGDVVFSWSGSLLVDLWCGGRAALNQHLFKVTSARYPKWFYYLQVKSRLPVFRRIAGGKATTMGHINLRHLSAETCAVPGARLLAVAGKVLERLIESRVRRTVANRGLMAVRDLLAPRLVSGSVSVDASAGVGRVARTALNGESV